ncbi:MAG: chemotaxis response regulator protein-glutamate methylesterase [Candidatus Cloacimonadota bacterium]|nr:MAG: chemotaxis response regulator protein-glutamate methylesterase [Candidatus Cloacimonadota bacterium]
MIRVLIVDDSLFVRTILKQALSQDKEIEVVGLASDAYDASEKIIALKPDVMTLDIEMPKMNGVSFLTKLIPQYPLPVIMVSSLTRRGAKITFDCLERGAVDFVPKPNSQSIGKMIVRLIQSIKDASKIDKELIRAKALKKRVQKQSLDPIKQKMDHILIGIGSSTGGTDALVEVISNLPSNCPGIAIVQHMPAGYTEVFADRLNSRSSMEVKEAKDGDIIKSGIVLIAPGGKHLEIENDGGIFKAKVFGGVKVNGHEPSVDILFGSIAKMNLSQSIGVILTGMGSDGAEGLLKMKLAGAKTIGQSEKSCVVYGMPRVAYNLGAVNDQLDINEISHKVVEYVRSFVSQ